MKHRMVIKLVPLEWRIWPIYQRSPQHGGPQITVGPLVIDFQPYTE